MIAVPIPPSEAGWNAFAMYWPSSVIAAVWTPSLTVSVPELLVFWDQLRGSRFAAFMSVRSITSPLSPKPARVSWLKRSYVSLNVSSPALEPVNSTLPAPPPVRIWSAPPAIRLSEVDVLASSVISPEIALAVK